MEKFQAAVAAIGNDEKVLQDESDEDVWGLYVLASRLEETLLNVQSQAEPAILARYTFNLAKAFNLFYHNHKIIVEADQAKRALLVLTADAVRKSLTTALDIMGIEVPAKM